MNAEFDNPQRVTLSKSRWSATITVTDSEGQEHKYIASADSGITYGDGLFLSTDDDYREALAEAGY